MATSLEATSQSSADGGILFTARNGGSVTVMEPIVQTSLRRLRSVFPRTLSLDELTAAARAEGIQMNQLQTDLLVDFLLRLWMMNLLHVHKTEQAFRSDVSERPEVWRFSRHQAASNSSVTTLCHDLYSPNQQQRWLLTNLDGTRSIQQLIKLVMAKGASREDAGKFVNTTVRQFAELSLLVA